MFLAQAAAPPPSSEDTNSTPDEVPARRTLKRVQDEVQQRTN